MKFRELKSAIVGQIGEQIVAREYRKDGWGVIASYKFSGANDNEAPAIEFEDEGREITPDLDASKGGRRIWVEVKTYGTAPKNNYLSEKLGRDVFVHGIPVRKLDNYRACESRTGSAVYLAVVQIDTKQILVTPEPLSQMQLAPCMCGGCRRKQGCRGFLRSCPVCLSARAACPEHRSMYPQVYIDKALFDIRGTVDERNRLVLDEKWREHREKISSGGHPPRRPSPQSATIANPPPGPTFTQEEALAMRSAAPCSRCSAAPGQPCRWEFGVYPVGEVHPERRTASAAMVVGAGRKRT